MKNESRTTSSGQAVPIDGAKEPQRRWLLCLAAAVALHAGLASFRPLSASSAILSPTAASDGSATLVEVVTVPTAAEVPGPAPGGGSLLPNPSDADEMVPAHIVPAPPEAPAVAPAPEVREDSRLASVAPEAEAEPDAAPASAVELLADPAQDDPAWPDTLRPGPMRKNLLAARRPTATAPLVAPSSARWSRHSGLGPGRGGGPGGKGRGWGAGNRVVTERFPFGGPSGAFRADVCFIPKGTPRLTAITNCPREVTFFTDTLDVPPRRFQLGFPGVTARNEWFAIRYRGTFEVRRSGQYAFRLVSDDGAKLWVDDYLIVDNDGQHPPAVKHGNMRLTAGKHRLFVSYFQGPRDNIALQLFVTPPNGEEMILTPRF